MLESTGIFDEVVEELECWDIKFVAEEAGVSHRCLYNWLEGKVYLPQMRTFLPVAAVLGFDIQLKIKNRR